MTPQARLCAVLVLLVAGISLISIRGMRVFGQEGRGQERAVAVAGVISGTVFQDYNYNGKRDTGATLTNNGQGTVGTAVDTGVAGVTVTAFDPSNIAVGTATSGADGSYSLNALGNGPYRIEFTNLPTGYFPAPVGDNTQSNVRFVSGVSAGNIDFGVVVPSTYCQDNPTLVTSCYVGGPQTSGNPVVVSFPYSAGSTRMSGGPPFSDFDAPAHANLTTDRQVGTLWGVAYARGAKTLYFSSFMKKHAGFGPSGPGAIYTINPANGSPSLFFNAGAAVGANPHDLNDFDRDNGNVAWDAVGKVAFGGVALNGPETRLYAMNLAERALYEFPTDVPPTAVNIRKQAVPATLPGCPSADDVRPFAVHWNEGRLYVGLTCTAESTVTGAAPDGDASKLAAYVYTVDPATLAFSAQPVFQAALNYPRGCADSAQLGQGACVPAAWRAWSKVFRTIGTDQRGIYPQPWLTDIAFDRGNLILGLRDRSGDQFGNFTLDDPRSSTRIYGVSAGDTLRASGNLANGWTLESNGRSGGNGTGPQNNGQGPGGAEFYFQDFYVPFNDENGIGGLLQVPGFPDVVVNSADPIPIFDNETLFDGGTLWHNNTSGARSKTYRVFDGTTALDIFGKANGLGDLVALCDPAPLEIGNRIWRDTNGNGIQDADEAGLAGVKVELYKNGIKVGETTTSASGTYYFNNANVPGGVLPQMNYEIRIDKTQAALVGLSLTKPDADSGDIRDSDATMVGDNAVISVTTGTAGQNNHDYDAGFLAQPTIVCPPNQTVCATAGGNTATVNYPGPTATNANSVSCNPAAGSSFPVGTTTVTCTATNTAGSVSCSFTVTVNPQPTITCGADITAVAASAGGTAVTYPAPTANNATSVMCSPASGSNFPVGMTTVTCNAANDCGTATCSFKVTVTAPPTIVCPPNQTVCATTSAGCQTFAVPALTHGFTTNAQLPQGDHFLLPQPFSFTVPQSTPGLNIFQVNPANFGGSISGVGGFDGTAPQGVSYATPNGRFTALSCTDSIWDFSFVVASTGATVGDTVTFFTQGASGSPSFNIVTLTVEAGGVRVTALNALVTLNLNSRLATSGKLAVGDLIPSAAAAGSAGSRTGLLTLSYLMQAGSPLDACLQLGMSINRGAGAGAVALLVTDVIVRRNEVAGDRARTQTGLLGGLTGGYPTGLVCPLVCPPCQVQGSGAVVNYPAPTTTNATGVVCNPPSGSSFPLGVTTVTCTASNAAGNASCSFTVTVKSPPTITCPADITATAPGATGMTITYPAPTATNATTVTCTPASGTNFPVGMTTVTCTATNDCGTVTCSFKVTVNQPVKCDTLCYRAPQWWLLNLDRMPGGNVLIAGVNGNQSVNTSQRRTIELALRGNPFGFALTPRQALNQEYVAAQLNVMSAGGNGSAVVANSMWTNLSCYGIDIPTTTLSNGAVITSGSMVKELYMQITLAIQERREVDFLPLARLLDLLNGNDPRGFCN